MKKNLKALAVLGACAVLALSAWGCGEKDTDDTTSASVTTESNILLPETEADTQATDDVTTEDGAGDTVVTSGDFQLGQVNGDVYTNDFFGIEIQVPEGWTVGDTKTLAGQSGVSEEDYNVETVKSNIESTKGRTYADLYIADPTTGDSINIQVSKPFSGMSLDKKQITAMIVDTTKTQLENQGIEVQSMNNVEVEVAGRTEPMLDAILVNGGLTGYEKQFYYINGDYVAYVTVASINGDRTADLLKYIKK